MSLPYDLAKLDFDGIRKRRRKRLLLWSLPLCIAAVLVGLGLGALYISQAAGASSYEKKQYQQATDHFGRFELINFVEPYKMKFNQGTALTAARQYGKGQAALERALELQPPTDFECQIRVNLVYAIAARAEALVTDKKYDEVILLFDTAKSVIDARDCGMKTASDKAASDGAKEADQKLQDQRSEITEKQNKAKQQRNGDNPNAQGDESQGETGKDGANDPTNASTPSNDQLQKLQNQQSQNAAKTRTSRGNARAYQNAGTYSERDYSKKTW
jgi:hypothetical protein